MGPEEDIGKWKCEACGNIVTSEKKPKKCTCTATSFSQITYDSLDKNQLWGIIDNRESMEIAQELNQRIAQPFMIEEIEEEARIKKIFQEIYEDIYFILEKYLEMDEKFIKIIALWIIGSYFHKQFNSFPYLFINAMRGSGKTRLLNLISSMAWNGSVQNSLTEAVLFRTEGTLCIDEFEKGGRKGSENLMELLNSAYKKGTKVVRMKKQKSLMGEELIKEEFELYRPVSMANITGIDNVTGDRCIKIIMEKSLNERKTKLIENLLESKIQKVRKLNFALLSLKCSLCNVVTSGELYILWNNHVLDNNTTLNYISTLTTLSTLSTLKNKFKKIKDSGLNGRDLELSFPLLNIAMWLDDEDIYPVFDEILNILKDLFEKKKEEELVENWDISLIDFLSQELPVNHYIPIYELTNKFRDFIQGSTEDINSKWMGRALKRLNLVKDKKRYTKGVSVLINYEKAQEKIKMFR